MLSAPSLVLSMDEGVRGVIVCGLLHTFVSHEHVDQKGVQGITLEGGGYVPLLGSALGRRGMRGWDV